MSQIKGKIIEKLPIKSGTGSKGPWSIAQIVIEFQDGQYTSTLCLQNSKNAEAFNALPVGATGTFDYNVSSRKGSNGSWYTSVTCYKWQVEDDMPV